MRRVFGFLIALVFIATCCAQQPAPGTTTDTSTKPATTTDDDEAKPRIFVTNSQSYASHSVGGGAYGIGGGIGSSGSVSHTEEIMKNFSERCPLVVINNRQFAADYVVTLTHDSTKTWVQHKDKISVFQNATGDNVISHSNFSLGGAVKDACDAITKDWDAHGEKLRARRPQYPPTTAMTRFAVRPTGPRPMLLPATRVGVGTITVTSTPPGADIEIDGKFVGNTPSRGIELTPGDHTVSVKKNGYKAWEKTLSVSGGDINLTADLDKQ